ncbi:MAG: outer membrane protein assembly factor BamA [Sphaerochaetaceae bacterium]
MLRKLVSLFIVSAVLFSLAAAEVPSSDAWWVNKPIEQFVYVDLHDVEASVIDPLVQPLLNTPYDQKAIDQLQKRLMETHLFLSVELIPSRFDQSRDRVMMYIEFVERQKLQKITFSGNTIATDQELLDAIGLQEGVLFDASHIDAAVQAIKRVYQQKRYDRVDVIPSYETDSLATGIDLSFKLTEYEWYANKPIRGFTFTGLKNVSQDQLEDLVYPYVGRTFSQSLYNEIEAKLYELQRFSLIQAEIKRGGTSGNDVYISIGVTELPVISAISFTGNAGIKAKTLEDNLTIKKGDFVSISLVNADKEALKKLYVQRGYAEVEIDSSYEVNEETNRVELLFTVQEGLQSKIREIVFVGNENMSESSLKKEISSKVQSLFNSGNYEKAKIAADTQAIALAYQKRGYIDVQVQEGPSEELSSDDENVRRLKVSFLIDEGEQWFFDGISVQGNTIFSDEKIASLLYMKKGSVLDISKVQSEIGKIADLYWDEGYVENTIDISEKRDDETRLVAYTVIIGEHGQASVEQILIRGLTKTKSYVLERELELKPGDIFSKDKYIRSAQNLYNTGLLVNLEPSISYGTQPNSLIITYDVEEGNQMNIGFGATFGGNVEGFPVSGFLSWSDTNVGGTGRDLEIMTELSPNSQTVSLGFRDTWVKDKRWSNGLNLSFNRSTYANGMQLADHSPTSELRGNQAFPKGYTSYEQWKDDRFAVPDEQFLMPYQYLKFSLGYTTGYTFMLPGGRLSLSVGPTVTLNRALFDADIYTPFDYLIGKYQESWQFSNRIGMGLSWDGRDLIANPTKGYVITQNLTYAGGVLGGLSNYMRTSTSASAFLKVFEIRKEKITPAVVSLNTTVSFMFDQYFPKSGDWSNWEKGIMASKYEYLYIDGITIARGISPEFYFEFLWDSSLEFSIQLAENILWAEAFISATGGSADLQSVGVSPLGWYFGAGIGIKLKVPGFPLGLYLVKNAHKIGDDAFEWEGGPIFHNAGVDTSGLKLVLAITTSIY